MFYNNIKIHNTDLPNAFAEFCRAKTENILNEMLIEQDVFNGRRKLNVDNDDFMLPNNIINAVKFLKIKNCEGHDRIPQRILIDGIKYLITPLSVIFNKIYKTKEIPEQCLIAKINPKTLKITGQFLIFVRPPKSLRK